MARHDAGWKAWLESSVTAYAAQLPNSPAAGFLADRGIDPAASGCRLGHVGVPMPEHAEFEGRLSIPYETPTGPVAVKFRALEDGADAKYLSLPGVDVHLFNVAALHQPASRVGITEGELDALVATSVGLPSVGCPGASSWRPFWDRLFADYAVVYVIGDGDEAGRRFAHAVSRRLPNARPVTVPGDVNEFYVKEGREALRNLLRVEDAA